MLKAIMSVTILVDARWSWESRPRGTRA